MLTPVARSLNRVPAKISSEKKKEHEYAADNEPAPGETLPI